MGAREYAGEGFVVTFDAQPCIHSARCTHGAPEVFDPQARPWIHPERGERERLAEVVRQCPTGALQFRLTDGTNPEVPDAKNSATLIADGPIHLRGRIRYAPSAGAERDEATRVALCRCGASANKPFCDGSHEKAGFQEPGRCARAPEPVTQAAEGEVVLNPIPNGPLRIDGCFELVTADGARRACGEKTWLCRCGHSGNKPFCDGTHKKIGFAA